MGLPVIENMPLRNAVLAIARQYGADGGIIILKFPGEDGFRTAVSGLTDKDIQAALYIGIHSHFLMMEDEAVG